MAIVALSKGLEPHHGKVTERSQIYIIGVSMLRYCQGKMFGI